MPNLPGSSPTTKNDLTIALARRGLINFGIVIDPIFQPAWFHKKIAGALERIERGELRFLMISMPPRHGKSALISIKFPAWYLGRNPEKNVIAASYGAELATDFGSKTRDLVASPEYQQVFGISLKEDSKAKDKWETNKGGYFISVGVGGALTGRGADLLLIDDPFKNREEAESEVIRKKVWDWYTSTAYTRLSPTGAIAVIATRWHEGDLIGRLLEQEGNQWEVIEFPAIAIENDSDRKVGEALWPEMFPLDRLEEIKRTIGAYDWQALYQQNPIASENQEFKPEYFRYFDEEDLKGKNLYITTTVDLAISNARAADRTAIVTVGKEVEGPNWYILDVIAGHLDPLETIDAIFATYNKYRQASIGIETVAYQKSLIYFLNEEMKRRKTYLPLVELKSLKSKASRIGGQSGIEARGLIPMWKTGVIHHRKSQIELEHEILAFPRGAHDDIIDALAYQLQLVPETVEQTKERDIQKPFDPFSLIQ